MGAGPVDERHYDLLRDAIFDQNIERFEELLKTEGVDVDHYDAGGQTLLHLASFWGRMAIVKLLLNAGASLKAKNAAGCTALDLAVHWGHSSVAEVIRLRGGRSVWEEKMGQLQIQVDDLRLQQTQLVAQCSERKRQYEELLEEYHALHKRFEEEKSAHLGTREQLEQTKRLRDEIQAKASLLETQLVEMTENYRGATIENARLAYLRDEAHRELTSALAYRDEVLSAMQTSIDKQAELTMQWQKAEMAAAMADSQRNFAFAEREHLQKQHSAALADLLVTTERLHKAEQELMTLKVELAEYIFEKERSQRITKRAARALEQPSGQKRGAMPVVGAIRPHTSVESTEKTVDLTEYTQKPVDRKQFSRAARDFGDKLRQREQKKSVARQKRHDVVENQYLTQGLNAPIVESDRFQEQFVTSLNAFATTRQEKWITLKHDRDRQLGFAENVMARSITTAPLLVPRRERLRQSTEPIDNSSGNDTDRGTRRALAPLRRKQSLNMGIYAEEMRPVTSPNEIRLRSAFYLNGKEPSTPESVSSNELGLKTPHIPTA
ncbi:hypothetical protein Poli38472_012384 [Pythium oligandrum]|uniref:Uncharacterized protein n=1 Tax=Pythium oligandrum TaxID=41045 RepID=A0A8K1CS13_PYTOL|nr:hypothetical protein Poli38472_012384 [Pythium oligandrum]|eukprot:TMW67268.1 hypothetical protein Poli38472_012384 [Pythium oligandrum]